MKRPRGWLFPGQQPARPITTRQLNRACHAAAEAAELDKRVSMHTLRHSFATRLLERKTDIRVIQVLLGHRKLETTAVYTRVALRTIREVTSPLAHLVRRIGRRANITREVDHRIVAALVHPLLQLPKQPRPTQPPDSSTPARRK